MEQNEILEETRRTNELLRGQLLWMRAAAALLAVLLAAVVVCLGNTMNSMGRISAALEGVGSGRCGRAGLEARYGRRKPRHQHTGR